MSHDLKTAQQSLVQVRRVLDQSLGQFAALAQAEGRVGNSFLDRWQIPLFQLAQLITDLSAAEQLLAHATKLAGDDRPGCQLTRSLALMQAADTTAAVWRQLLFRGKEFRLELSLADEPGELAQLEGFIGSQLSQEHYQQAAELARKIEGAGEDGLDIEQQSVQTAFRRFAQDKVAPLAERIHREDELLPDPILQELAQMGCFGLSIPARFGGFQDDTDPDHMAMVIVSDELSRASFGTAGSLITRPELLAKALLKGGTEAQKQKWLPLIASGEKQVAVAVTEPDYGSDVAHLTTTARRDGQGWRLNGNKMWCTYAGRAEVLMLLARTDPDVRKAHRGLSLFIVEKPAFYGHQFEHEVDGGRISGRAIATLGYRGMHSFEMQLADYYVPAANLVGEDDGLGQGFYLQMHGFAGSRLQTAGRALGIMAAAFSAALNYVQERHVFGRPLLAYPLTQQKLAQMAMRIQAARQLTYFAAREIDQGRGAVAAAMAKLLTARSAEWIAREAQQLHGGMGYAEEFPVSRHFVDARVLAIFEGAEEVLALRVIARSLLQQGQL